jgi:hypothetical protein
VTQNRILASIETSLFVLLHGLIMRPKRMKRMRLPGDGRLTPEGVSAIGPMSAGAWP